MKEYGLIMINFKIGNIFCSPAEALVNTVNCEGVMGKGLAYQFKKKYPLMEKDYIKACKLNRLSPGNLHFFYENKKLIINFPTKNKWREKSKLNYIESGLRNLKKELVLRNIKSVAIPPLGSGNGGLNWNEVKHLIVRELDEISNIVNIEVYEPSKNVEKKQSEPAINYETLLLLNISTRLSNPNLTTLNLTIKLIETLSNNRVLIKDLHKSSLNIRELKNYYHITNNSNLYNLLNNKIISRSTESANSRNETLIKKSVFLVNKYDNSVVEGLLSELRNDKQITNSTYNEILLQENIIEYNLFEERKINFL